MKETVKINLAQRLFDLDEDAYKKLRNYLDTLRKGFGPNKEEAEDILRDIEQRIAEILEEKLKDNKQVVTLKDIEEVIELMGTPEDFARDTEFSEGTGAADTEDGSSAEDYRGNRQLHRDIDNKIIGGVAAGLASYFRIDAIWIRLAFIILTPFNGMGLLLYIILWVVVPAALTRSQKLRMKGKPVNIDSIRESVKSEFNTYTDSESYRRTRETASGVGRTLGEIIKIGVKVVLILVGISFIFGGLALLVSLIFGLTAGNIWVNWHFPGGHYGPGFFSVFDHNPFFIFAVILVVLIPLIAILVGLMRLIFNTGRLNTALSVIGWIFWSLALAFVVISLVLGLSSRSFGYQASETELMKVPNNGTLYLELNESSKHSSSFEHFTVFGRKFKKDEWSDEFVVKPEIRVMRSGDETLYLDIEYTSLFPLEDDYHWDPSYYEIGDSTLVIDEYWYFDEEDIWKLPEIKLIIYVPDSLKLVLDDDFRSMPIRDEDGDYLPVTDSAESIQMGPDGPILVRQP